MTEQATTCKGASLLNGDSWHSINWRQCYREVRRLQARIVKATREGKHGKVKSLQWILTHSFSGRAVAVRRVTENSGKRTPGVDGLKWHTEFGHLNRGDMLTSEQHRCSNEKKKFQRRV
nr:reverse transcriptase N-terminal domain-containing protein [Escherichia coli]